MWVVHGEEFPEGVVFDRREDAMEFSKEERYCSKKAYVRVGYFTEEELEGMEEI